MQKEMNRNMTSKQAFVYSVEKAKDNVDLYSSTGDESYLSRAMSYIRGANYLIKEMSDQVD